MPAKSFISVFSVISIDVLGNILKRITAKRSRARIVDKILSMGLVSDRRDLHKKRKRSAPGRSTGVVRLFMVQHKAGIGQSHFILNYFFLFS